MLYLGRSILVSSPLGRDLKIDVRLKEIISLWEYTLEKVEAYHPVSYTPELGRDMTVSYAKYRIPHPSHILFLDADVVPRKNTLDKLMKMDVDIAMGVYPTVRNGNVRWSVSRDEPYRGLDLEELPRNPFKIKFGGFGVVLVKYEVFEALEWPYWKNVYKPGGIETGEDIYFCDKARDAGYDIWCDPMVKCNHNRYVGLLGIAKNLLNKKGVKQ